MQHTLHWGAGEGGKWIHLHPVKPLIPLFVPLQDACSGTWHSLHPQTLLERPLPTQVSSQEGGVLEESSEELQKNIFRVLSGQ